MSVLTLRKRIIYDTHGANIYINICTTKIDIKAEIGKYEAD